VLAASLKVGLEVDQDIAGELKIVADLTAT
jgi:hypothetical protein